VSAASVVLELQGESVSRVVVDGAAVDASSVPRRSGPALLALARDHPSASITWHDRGAATLLDDPESWCGLLGTTNEIRSTGLLHGADPWLATLGAADFDSALQLPPPADRPYGSWLLSPLAGVASAAVLLAAGAPPEDLPFAAWTVVLGHRAFRAGAFLWSDPRLVRPSQRGARRSVHSARTIALAIRHCFGRRFLLPWLSTLHGPSRIAGAAVVTAQAAARPDHLVAPTPVHWPDPRDDPPAAQPDDVIDVIIPTLGRRELLLDVLDDLAQQTLLPRRVIVVEQTGDGVAGLPLCTEGRPYELEHLVVQRLGAGNARNVALGRTDAPWVLMLDDDVRFEADVFARLLGRARSSGADAITAHLETVTGGSLPRAVQAGEPPALSMWPGFGSGAALVARGPLDEAGGFDRRIDGGFGEDTELGVRLRQAGAMVALASDPAFLHLKAPVGGMRAPYPHPWRWDPRHPRPSPTMVFARSTFETPSMAAGYRIHWWLDGLRQDRWGYRPRRRLQQWRSAQRWAAVLSRSEEAASARAVPPEDEASRPRSHPPMPGSAA
jgi:hypothetical protein